MNNNRKDIETTNTLDMILHSAKEEFLAKGFRGASMRHIAKRAGVTTGAIYGYFKDKDAIFVSLVESVLDGFYVLIRKIEQDDEVVKGVTHEIKKHKKYLDYLYDHYDVWKLIIVCSSGSSVENYIDKIIDLIIDNNYNLIDKMKSKSNIDDFTIRVILGFYVKSTMDLVKHDVPYKTAVERFDIITAFYCAGWNTLIE